MPREDRDRVLRLAARPINDPALLEVGQMRQIRAWEEFLRYCCCGEQCYAKTTNERHPAHGNSQSQYATMDCDNDKRSNRFAPAIL